MTTVSIAKGKGSLKHNDRTINNKSQERSWDTSKTNLNIVYKNESIRDSYHQLFDQSLEQFNAKQTRNDRKIKNYYEHISRSKQEKSSYEFIVQIGDVNDKSSPIYPLIQKSLDEYNRTFQQRNPNFYVVQQITHRDEIGMDHTHINFIPYSTNNKRGLDVRNSFGGALAEMGYGRNGFDKWRADELDVLQNIMRENGLEFTVGDNRQEHLNVKAYREYAKYTEKAKELQNSCMELTSIHNGMSVDVIELKTELDELEYSKQALIIENSQKTSEIAQKTQNIADLEQSITELEQKKVELKEMPSQIMLQDDDFRNQLHFVMNQQLNLEHLKPKNKNDFENHLDENDSNVLIKKNVFGGEQMVQMPLSFWQKIVTNHNQLVSEYGKLKKTINKLVDETISTVQKIIDAIKIMKGHPVYLDFTKNTSDIKRLKSECNELKSKNNILNNQLNQLSQEVNNKGDMANISDLLLHDMIQTNLYDDNGYEVNVFEYIVDNSSLSDYGYKVLKEHIDNHMQKPERKKSRDYGIDR